MSAEDQGAVRRGAVSWRSGRLLRAVAVAGLAALVWTPQAPVEAAEEPPARPSILPLAERIEAWTGTARRHASRPAGLVPGPIERIDAVRFLAGGPRGPERCVTDLLLTAARQGAGLNEVTRVMLDRAIVPPSGAGARSHLSPDGRFLIHFTDVYPGDDGDLDGVPDVVDRLAGEFTDALADFVHVLDWSPAPLTSNGGAPAARDVVDVFLVDLGGGTNAPVTGFTVPIGPTGDDGIEAANGRIFLDARAAGDRAVARAAVVHQVAHVVQMREALPESAWWHEASAVWIENHLVGNAAETARTLRESHSRRSAGIAPHAIGLSLESFLWPHYLSRSTGSDHTLLRQLWSDMAAVPGNNTLEAMDRILVRQFGTGLSREIAVFNVWNLFLGQADDGRHYSFGRDLPTPRGDAVYDTFPARGASLQGPLHPSGSALVQILGDGSHGGIRLRFEGGGEARWDVSLIVYPASSPGDARYVPVTVDGDGRASISFPWRRLAAVDMLIQNVSSAGSAPAHYAYSIEHDAVIPFDLMSFSVAEAPQGAVLTWSTDGEERMAGWNIYRSISPLGPYFRINRFIVPASGMPGRSTGYAYVDAQVEGGLKYYYQIEGVTWEGFTEVSHASGVRLPERIRRLRSR